MPTRPAKPKYDFHCLRCDKDFQSRSEFPARCPLCFALNWDMPVGYKPSPTQRVGAGSSHAGTARVFGGRPRSVGAPWGR